MSEPLSVLATIHYGKSPSEVLEKDGPFPIIGTGGRYGQANQAMFSGPAVVVPRKGSLGNPQLLMEPFWPVDTTYAVIPSKGVNVRWLYYNLLNFDLTKLNEATGVPSISREWLNKIRFFNPAREQKRKIGEILHSVDVAIEKTESLIDKCQQIKAGLMHDLFTRGVTADGKLRPPRDQAPELYQETAQGFFPVDWSEIKLGELAEIVSGVTLGSTSSVNAGIEVPYLRVANVQDGYLDLSDMKTIRVSKLTLNKLILRVGDVLMNEGGDFDKLGRGTVWEGEIATCIHQNHVFRVRPNTKLLRSHYLAYWSESPFGKKYFILSSKQSTNLASINSTQLHAYPIMVPGSEEQELIGLRIGAVNKKIGALEVEKKKLIFEKAGLMRDLLTGRVRIMMDEPSKEIASA